MVPLTEALRDGTERDVTDQSAGRHPHDGTDDDIGRVVDAGVYSAVADDPRQPE
jgi:hypothetical protein